MSDQVTIKDALDILDESGRRKAFNIKTRYSRDPKKERFSLTSKDIKKIIFAGNEPSRKTCKRVLKSPSILGINKPTN